MNKENYLFFQLNLKIDTLAMNSEKALEALTSYSICYCWLGVISSSRSSIFLLVEEKPLLVILKREGAGVAMFLLLK